MGIVPATSLDANDVTNAQGVMARITVLTAPPLPPTVTRALARATPLGLTLWPLVFCPPSLHVLLCLFLPLCLPPIPVLFSTLLW